MRLNKKVLFILTGLCLISLVLLNLRYPFFTHRVGNWSVGHSSFDESLEQLVIDPDNIISHEYIDSILPEPIDYIADPFFLKVKDTFYLFVELKGKGNADIALLKSADGFKYQYDQVVLNETFHLSYPHVFQHEGEFYMLPETSSINNVLLYKAEDFPYQWEVIDTLVKGKALKDPTLLLTEDLNLLIATDSNSRQFMFSAQSLRGEWKEVNNYDSKIGNESRPGGRFFMMADEWYLPLQNRSSGYGTGLSLYKLVNGTKGIEFEREHKLILKPQPGIHWFNRGMHHLDVQKIDGVFYCVFDGDKKEEQKRRLDFKRTLKLNLKDLYDYFQD